MTLLLDTCAFIWLTQEPERLSAAAQAAINDPANHLVFSHASAWEMHLKHNAGKLILPEPPRQWIPQQLAAWTISEMAIQLNAIQRTSDLPPIHRDPFDRLLAAQALEEGFVIVSPDHFFPDCGVPVVW
ncbi:MAG: type II toxin-antitoxin system VapC family toxin [Verrucomicrobia bacterium]|nr:type II toxin-antitoxin system VapC family toxin [Verrucomicrobiota bacterium]